MDRIRSEHSRGIAERARAESVSEDVGEEPSFDGDDAGALHRALDDISLKHREVLVLHFLGFSLAAAYGRDQPMRVYFSIGVTLLVLFTFGAVELLKHFINRARLQVVKEIKGLELRVLELEGRLGERSQ